MQDKSTIRTLDQNHSEYCACGENQISTCPASTPPALFLEPEDYEVETINDARWIPLTQGRFALVDKEDYPVIIQNKWCAQITPRTCYATRRINLNNPDETLNIYMHRQIANAPDGWEVDHINHNGLDNRKCNLRLCTHAQNQANRRASRKCKSRFKGVSESPYYIRTGRGKRWVVVFHKKWLGGFDSEKEAALVYDEALREMFGEFAYTNF